MQWDFLAIGDIATEPFIRLKEESGYSRTDHEKHEFCMPWGGKIPYDYSVVVPATGNAGNAAVAAARLGLTVALRAYVGQDRLGQECLETLRQEKIDTSLVVEDPARPTNYHYVLWYGSERTILVKHEEYAYTVPEISEGPKWIYLSSLAEHSLPFHQQLTEWFKKIPDTKLAFQPGTFQISLGTEALKGIYERSDIFFCNKEEAERILETDPTDDVKKLLADIQTLGPKVLVITDDTRGAYVLSASDYWRLPSYPDSHPPLESTGAGDSFASSITAALAIGLPLEEALLWGPVNAKSVVQEVGAQKGLLSREKIEEYLKNAPAEYRLTRF